VTAPVADPVADALHADVDAGHLAVLHWPDYSDYKPAVEKFYAGRQWHAAWVKGHKPTSQAVALTKLFAMSGSKGLNAEDYDAAEWQQWMTGLPHASDGEIAAFDTAMTVSAMRYISDLHIGRVNPAHFIFGVDIDAKKYDLASFVAEKVVAAGDVDTALAGIEPDAAEYRDLEKALGQYQQFAKETAGMAALPAPATSLSPGGAYAEAAALAARLTLLGDMAGGGTAESRYTQALADGVKSFQGRNGLPADGRLTPQTVAALNVPLAVRVQQLEDTLERRRWLAPEYQTAPIVVNVPEYLLRAYGDDHKKVFEMKVVVGDSDEDDHKTPVVAKEMKYLVFRPFWVVTPTIIKKEIVPHVEDDKSYIADKNFEVVDRKTGKVIEDWSVAEMAKGRYMVREKPGPTNSLGLVKFILPNKLNIYLHSTPAIWLFNRPKRDFSHGCIRLQDPEKLADWVLADQPKWTPDVIHDAMETGEDNKTVLLSHPIPVLIFYATARVAEDGKVHFFKDLYGYDADMESVLAKGDPFPVKPEPKKQANGDTA
jgi:murein L,D-transpeptidase YcbB/YkuD